MGIVDQQNTMALQPMKLLSVYVLGSMFALNAVNI